MFLGKRRENPNKSIFVYVFHINRRTSSTIRLTETVQKSYNLTSNKKCERVKHMHNDNYPING